MVLFEIRSLSRGLSECFEYLANFHNIEQWDPGVYRAQKITPGQPGPGSEFSLLLNSAGRRPAMRYVLKICEMDSAAGRARLLLQGEGESFSAKDEIELTAKGDNCTEIKYRAELSFSGAQARLLPLLKPWLKRVGKAALDGLEQTLAIKSEPRPLTLGQRMSYRAVLPLAKAFTQAGYLAMPDKGLTESMAGRRVLISGVTSGIGLAAAQQMAQLGAELILVGRGQQRLEQTRQNIIDFSGAPGERFKCFTAELDDLDALKGLVTELQALGHIDVLINNAGALFSERGVSAQGLERACAINLLSPWYLTEALLPLLRQGSEPQVINVVSGGMYLQALRLDDMGFENEDYDGAKAYARAKRGLMDLTQRWAQQYPDIRFNAMHPGWAATPGVEKSLPSFNQRMQKKLRDSRMGADTIVWLASAKAASKQSGQLWFDRQSVPTVLFSKTRSSEADVEALVEWLQSQR